MGIYSPVAAFWGLIFLIVPAAYLYILMVMLREMCRIFPETLFLPIQHYAPWLASTVTAMNQLSRWVEIWCCLEAAFYIGLKLHIKWLQTRDPLEASLSAAPMMELEDRSILWQRMMECEAADPVSFLQGWFFDQPLENISMYDVRDFIAWSMFEGRHQEHLTEAELRQLESFVEEIGHRSSLHLYGEKLDEDEDDILDGVDTTDVFRVHANGAQGIFAKKPKKHFQFSEESHREESNYFSDLYESYRTHYEERIKAVRNATADFHPVQSLQNMVHGATAELQFHPVQDLRNLMAETGKTIEKAEESAIARASQMYESLVPAGSQINKQLSAMSLATYLQMTEAWNSVKNMTERLETARFLQKQRHRIRQQLKGYRELLNHMREISSAVPSKQMASMMRRITECNEALELVENRAQTAFVQATGFAMKNIPFLPERRQPQRFAKYSSDPLLGIATYPLGFHMLVHGLTEVPLRVLMQKRGFERRVMGPVAYYFHQGTNSNEDGFMSDETVENPIVFVHGIGIGLLPYLPLVDALLQTGRPIFLPEIPYVSGFRPFQSPNGVLPPAVVSSTMTAMLASHGFLQATWMGHSYGSTWLSYMCKYAPKAVASLLFLDPICFCLHVPYLTKQFVYMRPDPGTVSYMIRTDVIINWTVQRSFPWAWISLFTEEIEVPCVVFLSEKDALVPAMKVEEYIKSKDFPVKDFESCTEEYFFNGRMDEKSVAVDSDKNEDGDDGGSPVITAEETQDSTKDSPKVICAVFRGDGHGDWTDRPSSTVPMIVKAAQALCRRVEERPTR